MSDNVSALSGRKGLDRNLFEELVKEGKKNGTPEPEVLRQIAKDFLIGDSITYGASTFYDFLKPENKQIKAYICNGSVCMLAGTQENLKTKLLEHLGEEEIGHMCCLGRCHENGSFYYRGENYSGKSDSEIDEIMQGSAGKNKDQYFVGTNMAEPILTAPFPDLQEFYARLIKAFSRDPEKLLQEIKDSEVRGRGGAGFKMSFKLESCKNTPSDQKFIVCNADEGDPGAYSDRYLMEERPHLVLFGMMVNGFITGASRGVLYIRGEYPESVSAVNLAIAELEELGLLGDNIKGSGFDFRFKVIEGAGAYVCGEETALLSSIEGQPPHVRVRPPYPTQEGLFNKPTVVNNVETLACIPCIINNSGKAYAGIGTGKSSGSKLVCLDSFFNRPGMYEVAMGTTLKEVVNELGQGFKQPIKALHIGGPLGGIVPVHKIPDLTLDFESFAENGFLLGHAGVVSIPENFPMIKYLEHLFEFTAAESCGKCVPCSIGSVRGMEMLVKAQHEDYQIDRKLMDDLLETLEVGSLCALGGGLPLGIKNALQYFENELKPYFINN